MHWEKENSFCDEFCILQEKELFYKLFKTDNSGTKWEEIWHGWYRIPEPYRMVYYAH